MTDEIALPKALADGLKRSDIVWIGDDARSFPSWFVFKAPRLYVLSQREPGPEEQTVPALAPGADAVSVTVRRKGRETALARFRASVRFLEGPEWEEAAVWLVDRRRSRMGPPAESIERWRTTCVIAELTPQGV